jgi:glutamate synthase domain-containing protein 2
MNLTLSHNASEIFRVLLNSKDRVKSEFFEKTLRISGAEVRECINEIIDYSLQEGYDHTAGSDTEGYFITRTESEYDIAIGNVYSREIKLRQRRQKLETIRQRRFGDKSQISLNM